MQGFPGGHMEERERKPVRRETLKKWIIVFTLIAVALFALAFFGGRWLEHRMEQPEERGDAHLRETLENAPEIEVNGQKYRLRQHLTTILLLGIDKFSDAEVKNSYRNGGQADFLRLLVIDPVEKQIRQIPIDRDTMTPITILGVLGNRTGTRTERISLSHGFGKGKEDSCQLTAEAVSNLLYDIPVNFFIALNMDGVSELNDLLGGVTVTLEDDFSGIDPSMTKGSTLTLTGDQAEIFLRSRMSVGVGTNESRMVRQQMYLSEAQKKLKARLQADNNAAGTIFDALEPFLTTNFTRGRLINEAYAAKDYTVEAPMQIAGEHSIDKEGFMQFVVDEEKLQETVLSVFYEKIV